MTSMKIEISEDRELILSEVFNGIGIKTDQGRFGIAQRDGGIEIVKDGKLVWSSTSGPRLRPASISSERPFTPWVNAILRRADSSAALCEIPFVDSLLLLLGILDTLESPAGKVLEKVGCVLAVRTEASAMASKIANAFERQEQEVAEESAVPEVESTGVKQIAPTGLEITAEGASSLMTQDTVPDAAPGAEELLTVRKFDDADETPDYETKHSWQRIHDRLTCNKCQALWTETNKDMNCRIADGERAMVQLGQCLATAEGKGSLGGQGLMRGAYGWSPALQAVKELWEKLEVANNRLVNIHGTVTKLEGYLLANGRERGCLEDKIRAQDEARAQMSTEYHDLVEGFKRSAKDVKELRVSLEAERAANADKVQIIDRQRRERRAIRTALVAGDMAELSKILNPPESDEPKSVEEPTPTPCDPERIKDKLVIRFDSLPGPDLAGFIEAELNGKGVNAGEWVQDEEYWLLVIDDYDPKAIADLRRENSRLKARAKDFRDELAARAMQGLVAKGPSPDRSNGNQKRTLAFHAYLYADEMLKQR